MRKYVTLNIWVCTDKASSRMDIKVKFEKEDWESWTDKEKEDFIKEEMLNKVEWGYTTERKTVGLMPKLYFFWAEGEKR